MQIGTVRDQIVLKKTHKYFSSRKLRLITEHIYEGSDWINAGTY